MFKNAVTATIPSNIILLYFGTTSEKDLVIRLYRHLFLSLLLINCRHPIPLRLWMDPDFVRHLYQPRNQCLPTGVP